MYFIGLFLGLLLYSVIRSTVVFVSGKAAGFYLASFNLFGFHYMRAVPTEPLKKHKGKFTIFPSLIMSKINLDPKEDKRLAITEAVIHIIVVAIISVIICYLWVVPSIGGRKPFYLTFHAGIVESMVLMSFALLFVTLNIIGNAETQLRNEYNAAIKNLRDGFGYAQLNISRQRIQGITLSDSIKILYLDMCFNVALEKKDVQEMSAVLRELDPILTKDSTLSNMKRAGLPYQGAYYSVLLFSSYIRTHQGNAMRYYQYIKEFIEEDMDFNGRTILAFYNYRILNRSDVAAELLIQAENNLITADELKFPRASKNLYKRLIEELKDSLDEVGKGYFDPKPILSYDE